MADLPPAADRGPTFIATAPREMGKLLAEELRGLGLGEVKATRAGARFTGGLEAAYRVCLWSRVASRVLLPLFEATVRDGDDLYAAARAHPWRELLTPDHTFAVDCSAPLLPAGITNSHFAALRLKDAVVDALRDATGRRPSVARERPDVQLHLRLRGERAAVFLDLAGESLHRRGYRTAVGAAPLKENVAACLLLLAGWPARAAAGEPFLDPLCGSGTLVAEAALLAADLAPALHRPYFGFLRWPGHDAPLWARLLCEARARAAAGRERPLPPIVGHDLDAQSVRRALENIERAGLRGLVHFERRGLAEATPPRRRGDGEGGLLVTNPPYGERLGQASSLLPLYTSLGDLLKQRFAGWDAYVLSGDAELSRYLGLRAAHRYTVFNGTIECRLLHYPISAAPTTAPTAERAPVQSAERERQRQHQRASEHQHESENESEGEREAEPAAEAPAEEHGGGGAEAFANRLRKNLRALARWARREGISCYRVYDADLPEYAVAVDLYERWVQVQEYAPPRTVDPEAARRRLRQVLSLVPEVVGASPGDVFLKVRRPQRREQRYGRQGSEGELHEVHEGGHRFLVNLTDYLDTGLFLDHRLTRALLGELAAGRSFLNLFAYTATASVYAARGGATSTTSVDLSATYLDWARRNLELNGVRGSRHRLLRADCVELLREGAERTSRGRSTWPRPERAWDRGGDPRGSGQRGGDPRGSGQRGGGPRGSGERGGDPRGGDPRGSQRGGAQRGGDRRGGDPRGSDPRGRQHGQGQALEGRYGLIFLDPPTFSNSKAMTGTLDVQRDHPWLIRAAAALLEPGGVLIFSNNARRFKLDRDALAGLAIDELTQQTLPRDFARNHRIHNVWRIQRAEDAGSPAEGEGRER